MNAPFQAQPISITPVSSILPSAPAPFLHVAIFNSPTVILGDETFRLVSFQGQESASDLFEFELELHANTDTGTTAPDYLGISTPPALPDTQLTIDELVGMPITIGINCSANLSAVEATQCFSDAVRGKSTGTDLSLIREIVSDIDTDLASGQSIDPNWAALNTVLSNGAVNPEFAYFNGIITAISMAEQGVYYITMGPALAQLKHTNAYTIYSHQNIISVIQTVIGTSSSFPTQIVMQSAINNASNASLATARVQDWLQAGESHYDFICRLMRKANLYFYFVHSATGHTVVFADNSNLDYPPVNTNITQFRYTSTDLAALGLAQEDIIINYRYQRSLSSSNVNSSFTRQYANFEEDAPTAPSAYQATGLAETAQPGTLPLTLYKSYDFGNISNEVSIYTQAASAALAANSVQFSGTGFCAQFRVGHQFSLANIASQNVIPPIQVSNIAGQPAFAYLSNSTLFRPSFAGCSFVLTKIKHQASAEGTYQNDFEASSSSALISGFSPQQAQQENLLAVVVSNPIGETPPNWTSFSSSAFDEGKGNDSDNDMPPSPYKPIGVYVTFAATATTASTTPFFVKLSANMPTIPEVGAIVVVSRTQNESELPEVQNVISTGGSLCVTPSGWDASSRVGNHYSTNFGDAQNINYGQHSTVNLPNAINIVSNQYTTGNFRDASYSQGASYSYTTAEAFLPSTISPSTKLAVPALPCAMTSALAGVTAANIPVASITPITAAPQVASDLLLSVSESYGSTYSQSQANVTSNVASVGTSFNQTTTGSSTSWSTTNTDNTAINTNLGTTNNISTNTGLVTNISSNLGDSVNLSSTNGTSTDVSVFGGDVNSTTIQNGSVTTNTTQNGSVTTTNIQTGNGKITTTTRQTGDIVTTTTQGGAITNTNTMGGVVTNTNSYLAAVFDTNSYVGAVSTITNQAGAVSTITNQAGAVSTITNQAGAVTTNNTQLGIITNTETKMGLVNSTNTFGGIVTDTTNCLVARTVNVDGLADNVFKNGVEQSETTTSATTEVTETSADKTDTRTHAMITMTETYTAGTITRSTPGVVETITCGMVTRTCTMYTFM